MAVELNKDAKLEVCSQDNMRTEYAALSSFFGRVITFRFTTLAFYLATVALILSAGLGPCQKGILLLGITLCVWNVELRNRTIFLTLARRGMQIEYEWGYREDRLFDPFYQRMMRDKDFIEAELAKEAVNKPPPPVPVRMLWGKLKIGPGFLWLVSHTLAIDLLFLFVLGWAGYLLLVRPDQERMSSKATISRPGEPTSRRNESNTAIPNQRTSYHRRHFNSSFGSSPGLQAKVACAETRLPGNQGKEDAAQPGRAGHLPRPAGTETRLRLSQRLAGPGHRVRRGRREQVPSPR